MTTILTLLTPGYADWETALLNAAARSYYDVNTLFASLDGGEVVSAGGLRVVPGLSIGDVDVQAVDAVLVNGGTIWSASDAPDVSDVLRRAAVAGKIVGVSATERWRWRARDCLIMCRTQPMGRTV